MNENVPTAIEASDSVFPAIEGTFPTLTRRMMSIDRLLRHAVRHAVDQSNRVLSAWAMNHMHLHALVALAAAPGGALSIGDLGDAMGEDLVTASRISSGIVARGLADRARGTLDRRTVVIRLSDSGTDMLEEVVPSFAQLLARQLQVLGDEELATLENLLGRLLCNLDELRP
jgi:MarR family transcriptional repressor of emrRAB